LEAGVYLPAVVLPVHGDVHENVAKGGVLCGGVREHARQIRVDLRVHDRFHGIQHDEIGPVVEGDQAAMQQ
jgi:hypothetical protein